MNNQHNFYYKEENWVTQSFYTFKKANIRNTHFQIFLQYETDGVFCYAEKMNIQPAVI